MVTGLTWYVNNCLDSNLCCKKSTRYCRLEVEAELSILRLYLRLWLLLGTQARTRGRLSIRILVETVQGSTESASVLCAGWSITCFKIQRIAELINPTK